MMGRLWCLILLVCFLAALSGALSSGVKTPRTFGSHDVGPITAISKCIANCLTQHIPVSVRSIGTAKLKSDKPSVILRRDASPVKLRSDTLPVSMRSDTPSGRVWSDTLPVNKPSVKIQSDIPSLKSRNATLSITSDEIQLRSTAASVSDDASAKRTNKSPTLAALQNNEKVRNSATGESIFPKQAVQLQNAMRMWAGKLNIKTRQTDGDSEEVKDDGDDDDDSNTNEDATVNTTPSTKVSHFCYRACFTSAIQDVFG